VRYENFLPCGTRVLVATLRAHGSRASFPNKGKGEQFGGDGLAVPNVAVASTHAGGAP